MRKLLFFNLIIMFTFFCEAAVCNTKGNSDKYILALTWLPGICKTHEFKECKVKQESPILDLHGLWPDKKECGINYSYCGEVKEFEKKFCEYPEPKLNEQTKTKISSVMPGYSLGTCLERHEWWKHGTCPYFLLMNIFQMRQI